MTDGGPSAPGLAEPSRTDRASGIARVAVPAVTREAGNWNPQTQTQAGRGVPTEPQVSSRCPTRASRTGVEQKLSMELVNKVDRGLR